MKELSGMFEKLPFGQMVPQEQQGQDPIELLKGDHKRVKELFQKFEQTEEEEMQAQIAQQICLELKVHAKLEEMVFYPEMREIADDEDMMDEAAEEHHVVEFLVGEIERMKPSDERFKAKVTVLKEVVEHHVKEEEGEMFPKFNKEEAGGDEFTEEMMTRKQQLMDQMQRGQKPRSNGRGKAASSGARKSGGKSASSKKSASGGGRGKSASSSKKAASSGRGKSTSSKKSASSSRGKSTSSKSASSGRGRSAAVSSGGTKRGVSGKRPASSASSRASKQRNAKKGASR